MRTVFARDDGFAITTILLIASVATAVIVGGSSTTAAVMNRNDIQEATGHMQGVAADIRQRTAGDDSAQAREMRAHADKMDAVAGSLSGAADKDLLVAVTNNVGDAVLTPIQGGAVITAAKFAWDVKSGWELGDTAMDSWGITDPGADPLLAQLRGLEVPRDLSTPVEQAIIEAKLKGARAAVSGVDPGLAPDEVEAAATQLVLDVEVADDSATVGTDPYRNGYVVDGIARHLGWTPVDDAASGDGLQGGDPANDGVEHGGALAGGDDRAPTASDAGDWITFLFSKSGTYWPGSPDPYATEGAIRASAEAFLGADPDARIEVLGIGPTDAESAAWPVRFRMAAADAGGNGMVFLTLVYTAEDGYFASPVFLPDPIGGARAALSD
ncbi:MAG: hypothetical protein JW733_01750 [Coriobacteriia bacterium]|nr:hypothetical protein [Coriobacteriia bacterium]MBN2848944.1 hypothetical protein [Coriobacteriia bacterium]